MEAKDFLSALRGTDPEKWLEALNSGYLIKQGSEAEAVLRVVCVTRKDVQEAALELVKNVRGPIAFPIQRHLALAAVEPELRRRAIEAISEQPDEDTTEVLQLAAYDEHAAPKEAALRRLRNRRGEDIQAILLNHAVAPERYISQEYRSESETIRTAALSALTQHDGDEVIGPLIRVALAHRQHRDIVFEILKGIEKVRVSAALIETMLEDPPEGLPAADGDFENRALKVIAAKPPRKGRSLANYRSLLRRLYQERLRPNQAIGVTLEQQLAEAYDDAIGEIIVDQAKRFAGNPEPTTVTNIASQTTDHLAQAEFSKALSAWIAMLDIPQDQVATAAAAKLGEKLKGENKAVVELVAQAIRTGAESARHKRNRLPAVVTNAGLNPAFNLSKRLLPMLAAKDSAVRNQSVQYLRVCRGIIVNTVRWTGWLKLIVGFYKDKEKARPELLEFLADTRDNVNVQKRADLWVVLMESEHDEHKGLLKRLVSEAPNPSSTMKEILELVIEGRGNWGPAKDVLDEVPGEARKDALAEALEKGWQYSAWNYLAKESPGRAAELARRIIPDAQYRMPERHRAHLVEGLGTFGAEDDADLLLDHLSSGKKEIRRAAALALGHIGTQSSEGQLRDALRDKYADVVGAAIHSLRKVATPEAETVHMLRERAEEDPSVDIKTAASDALGELLEKHLGRDEIQDVGKWLETLRAFGRSESGARLETLLNSTRLDDKPHLRADVATTIGACCEPNIGLEIVNRQLNEEPSERDPEVRRALEAAQDELSASPDMALLRLLNKLVDTEFDREELLGDYSFDDLFSRPDTVAHLRAQVPKAIKAKGDPDTFVTRLDGIADVIGDEVEDALTREYPESADPSGRRGYASQIEFFGRARPDLKRAASALHGLREKSDLPHVADNKSGEPRPGCDAQDESDARRHFQVIVQEAMKYLRNRRSEERSDAT